MRPITSKRGMLITAFGLLAACLVVGCGGDEVTEKLGRPAGGMEPVEYAGGGDAGWYAKAQLSEAVLTPSMARMRGGILQGAPPPNVERKIIYNATVEVVVEEFQGSNDKVRELVKTHKGYIANSDITGSSGTVRTSKWTLRIPADRFDAFLQEVQAFGEVTKNSRDSKDVTEEYYDVEARIKNKKVEEDRLLKHLEKSTINLKDTLDVEKELSRVRGEIEQMQGRLQYLANMTALTTVTLTLHERKTYVPPTAPEFTTTAGRTWDRSWTALVDFGKGLALFFVALTPWLPVIALGVVPAFLLIRRAIRRSRSRYTPLTVEVVPSQPS